MTKKEAALNAANPPILVTGAHRSGTTWLANMLCLAPDTLHVSEPFNLDSWAYRLDGLAQYWFTYAPGLSEERAKMAFCKVLERRTGLVFSRRQAHRYLPFLRRGRLIIKDPIACFSSEWLSGTFGTQVVVVVRHPAAFALSLQRMNWRFDFRHLREQPLLMEHHLSLFADEIEDPPKDILEQAALLWKLIYTVLGRYVEAHPEWILCRHEDMSLAPILEFRDLYKRLGLVWSDSVEHFVQQSTGTDNPTDPAMGVAHQMRRNSAANATRWKGILDSQQIARIRKRSGEPARCFYPDHDW